ncbi:cation transporter [Prosthecochloris sp. GSB1]|uniref:cation diffusion facilitator family transporter n=1 Tax=Prosthecochloris sp. GSB1 TaxID=281093 RepID=UPI000B8CBB92|nr:cation diffusion facilitator family transporter [Prosthecochloris sp. GSB1]ASQ90014.1 cation transporter [Prosthecochloris sp. GSB1]
MGHHQHHNASGRNIRTAFFLNLGFTAVEFIGGIVTNSTAILADAVHDLGDSVALGQAWYFERLSGEKGNRRYTYGYRRFSILGAILSTAVLLGSSLFVIVEALPRIFDPQPVHAEGMAVLAVFGIAVNGLAMSRLSKDSGMNARTVALHLLEDVLGWAAVLVTAIVLLFADIPVLDPILALGITVYILTGVVRNLMKLVPVLLQAAPEEIDIEALEEEILNMEHVRSAHHAHLWSMDGRQAVFSVHLDVDKPLSPAEYRSVKEAMRDLVEKYGIHHSTVEIEFPEEPCRNSEDGPCS